MKTFEWITDTHHPAQGREIPERVDSEADLAFILVDPTVQVKDRPYQRHVRSHVMRDFQRRKEARERQSKHARGSNLEQQLLKVGMQLRGAAGQEGPPSTPLPPNPQVWSQPMTLLDAGMVDPFNCLAVALDRAQYGLIDYWISEMAPTFAPYNEIVGYTLDQAVLSYAVTDEALMHAFLSTFALYRGDLLQQGHDDHSYMRERASAINLINSRLEILHLAVADTTIATVAVLAANEQVGGNLDEAIIHSNGLRRMISLRGGMGALPSNPVLRVLIDWVLPTTESQLAQSKESPRLPTEDGFMDTADYLIPEFQTVTSSSELTVLPSDCGHTSPEAISGHMLTDRYYAPGAGFAEIRTVCNLDAGDLRLLDTIRSLTITTESLLLLPDSGPVDLSYLSGLWSSIARRLLDWTIPNAIDPIFVLKQFYQRTCRLSTLIYADLMIRKFQLPDNLLSDIRTNSHQHTQRLLNRTLCHSQLYKTKTRPVRELLFWCFFLDGLKAKLARETGTSWLAPGIKAFCTVLTLHTWSDVRKVLELFLWSRARLDEDGEKFWIETMAMPD
ncbi:hypothetical protein MMC11_008307 [Xylographa trunciseda]|nr:hypothetical protein [Xylographa trunciseda]